MGCSNKIVPQPKIPKSTSISDRISASASSLKDALINFNFSKFHFKSISIKNFNNCFKDKAHICDVAVNLLGKTLPIISGYKYGELCAGGADLNGLHFHVIGERERDTVRRVLREYSFSTTDIEQMNEGNGLVQFSGTMGHVYPIRIVCHKYENVLYLLFVDTNHHIYINESKVKETLFYEECPEYIEGTCHAMKYLDECFAFGYLNVEKIRETYSYTESP